MSSLTYCHIDLGGQRSKVATLDSSDKPQILPNPEDGTLFFPTAVYVDETGAVVGNGALTAAVTGYPSGLATNFKRYLGENRAIVETADRLWTAEDLTAEVVKYALSFFPKPPTHISASVPPKSSQAARDALHTILESTGAKVVCVTAEPLAAIAHYQVDGTFLVIDGGGFSVDGNISTRTGAKLDVAGYSTTRVGGHDVTNLLLERAIAEFSRQIGQRISETEQPIVYRQLYQACESCKLALSRSDRGVIAIPAGEKAFSMEVTHEEFVDLTKSLVDRIISDLRQMLDTATTSSFSEVVIVGGTGLLRPLRDRIQAEFGKAPLPVADPLFAVCLGGALIGRMHLSGEVHANRVLPPLDELREVADKFPSTVGMIAVNNAGVDRLVAHVFENESIPVERQVTYTMLHPYQKSVSVRIAEGEPHAPLVDCDVLVERTITGLREMANPDDHDFQLLLRVDKDSRIHVRFRDTHSQKDEAFDFVYAEALQELKDRLAEEEVTPS